MVTGASDGIGKEFSLQLAAKGFNVLLVSRTQSKLLTLAEEILAKYPSTETEVLAIDFAQDSESDYARLADAVQNRDIAILINNVGRSHDIPVSFLETSAEEIQNIVTININATLKVTQIIAPGMVQRRRGLVLTMGSFGGFVPTPYLATYSGSKAFLQHWSTALASELEPSGVKVQLAIGYLITSAMSKVKRPSMMVPTPRQFVKMCLSKIGMSGTAGGRTATITPYWSHGLMHWAVQEFFGIWSKALLNYNRGMHVSIRKRALKKKEREAAVGKKGN